MAAARPSAATRERAGAAPPRVTAAHGEGLGEREGAVPVWSGVDWAGLAGRRQVAARRSAARPAWDGPGCWGGRGGAGVKAEVCCGGLRQSPRARPGNRPSAC